MTTSTCQDCGTTWRSDEWDACPVCLAEAKAAAAIQEQKRRIAQLESLLREADQSRQREINVSARYKNLCTDAEDALAAVTTTRDDLIKDVLETAASIFVMCNKPSEYRPGITDEERLADAATEAQWLHRRTEARVLFIQTGLEDGA